MVVHKKRRANAASGRMNHCKERFELWSSPAGQIRDCVRGERLVGAESGTIDTGGNLNADVWGTTQGTIDATGAISLHAYGSIVEAVTSTTGAISGGSWAQILGDLDSGDDDPITMFALQNIEGDADAGATATLTSLFGDIKGDVTAGADAYLLAENIDSGIVSAGGEAYLYADQNISGGATA